jgi:glycosyltransferase involved in cell wall biosynthesis
VIEAAALAGGSWPVVVVAPRMDEVEYRRLMRIGEQRGVELTILIGVEDDELVRLYQRARATLYLARGEPFGLASLEAQACGSPVIVSKEGGLPETIVDGVSGWAVERSAREAAGKLKCLEDVDVAQAMGLAGSRVARAWTWASSAEQLHEVLREVAS